MKNIHITEKDIIDYKIGKKSATLNMALAYRMPYIAETEARTATETEKTLMAAELLSKQNNDETIFFLQDIIHSEEAASGLVLGVSLLTIAKTIQNESAIEYLKYWGPVEQGTSEDAIKVINIFNDEQKISSDDMLNFLVSEVKKYTK